MSGAFDDASYKPISREEVAKNNTDDSLWCIIDHRVYDLTEFLDAHPGGSVVLQQVAGKDATVDFFNLHRYEVLQKYSDFCIGVVKGEKPEVIDPKPGDVSLVPYAEPLWLSPVYKSPYYNDSHHKLRRGVREFVDSILRPHMEQNELNGTIVSKDIVKQMADNNIIAARLGPGPHLKGRDLFGVRGEDLDYFHDLVMCQELVRIWSRGSQDGNIVGLAISLTAVRSWMKNTELREKVTEEVLSGEKMMVLCVTEAFAGSDVAGIRTTVTKSKDGKSFIVNGTKKWITNGTFSDYFVVAGRSEKGHTVVLVPRSDKVTTKPIKTSYSPSAGTAFIEFDNVEVPADHILGEEHKGFAVVMSNFNHERWAMAASSIRYSRFVVEECLKWCHQRIVFGKPLINQPVIRSKLARMIMLVEAGQGYLEQITYQMNNMSYELQSKHLGGQIGLLKAFVSRTATEVADLGTNIFGGRGITQTGMGTKIEQFNRTYKFDSILGGTEEILMDLAVRQASKQMPKSML